ncbi:MAG: aspartate/glutamate racemase family protein [Prochloron sp. SP5CPC1]|nr:aspartate/glutamate racemase family protein [Candidatus Paraprochloron terpiosi SP5CPC1]
MNSLLWPKVGSWKQFAVAHEAIAYMPVYMAKLKGIASQMKAQGKWVEDQDFPVDILSLHPPHPNKTPLILLGGMGPLAGAMSFQKACQYCGNSREIVLYQACGIPSRVKVMLDPNRLVEGISLRDRLVKLASDSIIQATEYLQADNSNIQVMLLCNGSHYFLPQIQQDLENRYRAIARRLNFVSLVDAVMEVLQCQRRQKVLVLGTTATLMGGVYTQPLQQLGIDFSVLPDSCQSRLMDIIYYGVKAFDKEYACAMGEQLFSLLENVSRIDFAIAGCTEIPIFLDWLQAKIACSNSNSSWLNAQKFLAQVEVLDPVCLALHLALGILDGEGKGAKGRERFFEQTLHLAQRRKGAKGRERFFEQIFT